MGTTLSGHVKRGTHLTFNAIRVLKMNVLKRGTHLIFNAMRVLKKNVLTFCLRKVLIKCRVSTCVKSPKDIFFSILIALNRKWVSRLT